MSNEGERQVEESLEKQKDVLQYLVLLLLLFAQAAAVVVVLADVLAHVVHAVHQHLQAFLEMRAGEGKAGHIDFIHAVKSSQTTTNTYCRFTSEPT